jgi:hypothetical protein
MIDFEALGETLRRWLVLTTGLQDDRVIYAHQTAPRPHPGAFAVLRLPVSLARLGMDDAEVWDATGNVTRIGHRRMPVQVDVIGVNAHGLLAAALDGLQRYDVGELLTAQGLAVIDPGSVRDLTALLQTTWEARAQADVIFGLGVSSTEAVGYIAQVEYDGEYSAGGVPPVTIHTSGTIPEGA